MQIRCYYCHRPFAIGREAVHAALDMLTAQNLSHYDAQCPHCRRVNRVSRQELLRAAPDWSETRPEQESNTE
jgi:phage FluMu protein Com